MMTMLDFGLDWRWRIFPTPNAPTHHTIHDITVTPISPKLDTFYLFKNLFLE
jgi:hypothetical protein